MARWLRVSILCLSCAPLLACRNDNPEFDRDSLGSGSGTSGAESKGEAGEASGDGDGEPATSGDGDGEPPTRGDGDGEPDTAGDGDGEPDTAGDGDGEPPDTLGDGDGEPDTAGDGDGEPDTSGDGDGDPDTTGDPNQGVCEGIAPDDPCLSCAADFCCSPDLAACLGTPDCSCMVTCTLSEGDVNLCVQECLPGDDSFLLFELVVGCVSVNCQQDCL